MRLSRYEQETVINYNEEEGQAQVYTYNKALQRKLDKLCCNEGGAELRATDKTGSKTYIVPKSWIKVAPKKKVNLSDEQRKAIGERLSRK